MSKTKIEAAIAALEPLTLPELKQALAHLADNLEDTQLEKLAEFVSSLVG